MPRPTRAAFAAGLTTLALASTSLFNATDATAAPTPHTSASAAGTSSRPAVPTARPAAMNERVLWQENFDRQASATGFTHRAPRGWTVRSSGFTTGEARWAGWAFTNVRDWTWAVGTDRRHWFTGAHNTFAVVESEHQRLAPRDRMTTTLTSPAISVKGEKSLVLRFASHYAQGKTPQSAGVYVSFDGGRSTRLLNLTRDHLSSHEALTVAVPTGAKKATFSWTYSKGQNDKWWGIDDISLARPMRKAGTPLATFDVVSDIHAPRANANYAKAVQLYARQRDKAGAMLIAGDIVETGSAADYASATSMLKASPHRSGKVFMVGGNHEYLGKETFATIQKRFLTLAGRKTAWGETSVNGIPVLGISTEYYSDVDRKGVEPYVHMSAKQDAWLASRLAHYSRRGTPVILMAHHPLPQTVSFSHSAWYGNDFADLERLNGIIAKYPNIIYLSGHTHAWLGLNDWWGRYRVNGSGNPAGFPAINTGALINAGVPDDDHDEKGLKGDHATGLRIKVYRDRVRVEAWNILTGKPMKSQDFPVTQKFAASR